MYGVRIWHDDDRARLDDELWSAMKAVINLRNKRGGG